MEREHIERVIAYIEAHLKEELNNSVLSGVAGYSKYHFLRLFQKHVCLTPAAYIRKRRITEITRQIGKEAGRPMTDISFEYGFNSKENFTRAFQKEHGILPSEFKSVGCSLRLTPPFRFDRDLSEPTVSLQYVKAFTVAAFPETAESPVALWNRYNASRRSLLLSGGRIVEDFGVMIWNPARQALDYHIGIRREDYRGEDENALMLPIEEGIYAVFETPPSTQHEFVGRIKDTWQWIYNVWFPESGYRRAAGYEFETYVESSKKYAERIYVPIEKE